MSGKVVQATNLDSVRIEVLGGSRALTILASLPLAADTVLRELGMDTNAMLLIQVEGGENAGPNQWCARLHGKVGRSITPWGAVQELANKLEVSR